MTEFYKEYFDSYKKITQEDYEEYKEIKTISIFINVIATYMGYKNIDLLNPIRIQQLTKYIRIKHSDIFELNNFNIYKVTENLEDNINKDSLIIPMNYIEKIVNIWNEYVEKVETKKITMWCDPVYNIRNPYILTYIPCTGTKIKLSTKHLNKNAKLMYATFNEKEKWCIHSINLNNEVLRGLDINLDKNKEEVLLELNKNKEYETECKILKGVSQDELNKTFILKTYEGTYVSNKQGYDIPFCIFFDNGNDDLIKIKDFSVLRQCLNIKKEDSILITVENLEYYSHLLDFTVNPNLINYNNLKILHNYPCNIDINKKILKIIYGQKYSCSYYNIKNSQIKYELDMGNSFIGEYEEVESFLKYIDNNYKLSNLLTHYEAIEIKKNNSDYVLNPCNKRVEFIQEETGKGLFNFYYGTSTEDICNNIFKLSNIKLKSKLKNINVDAHDNEYIYYCSPSKIGECTFTVNGFIGGFVKIKTIKLENSDNIYNIYRSINKGLGRTTVEIE